MGNSKTYFFEGELARPMTLDALRNELMAVFRTSELVVGVIEEHWCGRPENGQYVMAALFSSSMIADRGYEQMRPHFKWLGGHRLDANWPDLYAVLYDEDGEHSFRADVDWDESKATP